MFNTTRTDPEDEEADVFLNYRTGGHQILIILADGVEAWDKKTYDTFNNLLYDDVSVGKIITRPISRLEFKFTDTSFRFGHGVYYAPYKGSTGDFLQIKGFVPIFDRRFDVC